MRNPLRQSGPKSAGSLPVSIALALFALVVIFGGGASRNDALSQPIVWLFAIALGLTAAWGRKAFFLPELRGLGPFFLALTIMAALQLIPLPPSLWASLPGRGLYAETGRMLGLEQPWRPMSLTPDATWSSLLSLLPPFAILIGSSALTPEKRRLFLPVLLGAALLSGMLGLAQSTGGSGGMLRYYAITNPDAAVGIFANRNHNALLLVLALPMLVVWSRTVQVDRRYDQVPRWTAIGLALVLLPMILLTGSRAGLLLLALAVPASLFLTAGAQGRSHVERVHERFGQIEKWLPPVLIGVVIIASVIIARSTAIDRIAASTLAEEQRSRMFPTLLEMAGDFFPFGSGFGSFDSVYRTYEPLDLLNASYMNQAHNDLAQLVIEGGLPGVLALGWLVWWVLVHSVRHWRSAVRLGSARLLGRLGSVMVLLIFLASLVDYPLRTPIMAVVFTISLIWLAGDRAMEEPKAG